MILLKHQGLSSSKPSRFEGENSLHILAVNRRESALVELIELCVAKLTDQQLTYVFLAQVRNTSVTKS